MRFFNLDLHISVIADVKQIFQSLGHEVTDWSLSGHAWVFGRKPDPVDIVSQSTWRSLDRSVCDAFYNRYRDELADYDAFIVTHTPCFAMLYERWNKPVICVASTRYEYPFSDNREAWEDFNDYLRRKIDAGLVIPLANNQYDADYAEYFTQRPWRVIPSICAYTNAPYTGTRPESLYYSRFKGMPEIPGVVDADDVFQHSLQRKVLTRLGLLEKRDPRHKWTDLADFRSIVRIPYNASMMSIFEMYSASIPMLFPSLSFSLRLYSDKKEQGIFSQLSYNQVFKLPSRSMIPSDELDPNNYEDVDVMAHWIAKSDFYDSENMDGLQYFDSFEELKVLVRTLDAEAVHGRMKRHNEVRRGKIIGAWTEVLDDLALKLGTR